MAKPGKECNFPTPRYCSPAPPAFPGKRLNITSLSPKVSAFQIHTRPVPPNSPHLRYAILVGYYPNNVIQRKKGIAFYFCVDIFAFRAHSEQFD